MEDRRFRKWHGTPPEEFHSEERALKKEPAQAYA